MSRFVGRLTASILAAALAACSSGGGSDGSGGSSGGGGGGGGSGEPWLSGSYFPAWQNVAPVTVLPFAYNGSLTSQQNGANLKAAIAALTPGQMLEIGSGTYSVNSWWNVVLNGTAQAPIWIVAAPGAVVTITRPDANQNVMNVGSGAATSYVCFRGLEFTGGDDLIKLYSVSQLWIDQCWIHDGSGVGIAANSANTDHLYITRNHIHDPGLAGDTAEGMYLGANNGAVTMSYSTVALNHVHDTGGTQGDGIEVKQGSTNNWIVENHVHDTNYPCILVYGTAGAGINLVERNTLYNSNDNVMQVQGEAIVRNNLLINGNTAFTSTDHQGLTTNLQVVHNTMVNTGRCANLSSWNNRAGMVWANNACYSQTQESIRFPNGSTGVTLAGNVVLGPVVGAASGTVNGTGLADFTNVSWNAVNRNGLPSSGSPLIGAGAQAFGVADDITGAARTSLLDTGAWDKP